MASVFKERPAHSAATPIAGDSLTDRLGINSAADAQIAEDLSRNRRFACPGLFRIVPSRDGGICRIKLAFGQMTAAQLRAIADGAARFGSPAIEVTNRANIQIRAVAAGNEDALIELLVAAGLGPRSAGADDVRNLMVSPVMGLDPTARIDVAPLAASVLARLENDTRYHRLSPKFSIQIDGGESVAMVEHPNDIWLAATDAGHFAIGLAGCPDALTPPLGIVAAADAEATLFALLDLFLARAGKEVSRFRHLLTTMNADDILALLPVSLSKNAAWRRPTPQRLAHLGVFAQKQPDRVAIGAVPPLGRLDSAMLRGLAELADEISGGEIRLTPWQSVMLPNVAAEAAPGAQAKLAALGFVTAPGTVLASLVTCAGSAGCASGLADTKSDALALAAALGQRKRDVFGIHLTGCSKSCAAPRPAPVTLLGVAPGTYDLFIRAENSAETTDFGKRIGAGLTIEQLSQVLAQVQAEKDDE